MIRRLLAALAAAALLAGAPPARADDVSDAKVHLRRGTALYRASRWREAIAEFEAAYRVKPHGAIHFNVAQCRERLAEWPAALRAWNDYLREVPDAKDRAAVRASIGRIEARLAGAGVQALLVYTDPPGAEVRIDGKPRGATPLHAVLSPGSYALSLSLDGYRPVSRELEMAASPSRVVDEVLAPSGAPAPAPVAIAGASRAAGDAPPARPAPADLAVKPARSAAQAPLPAAPAEQPRVRRRVYTWIAAGTALAAAAAGAYYGADASRDEDAIDAIVGDGALADRTARDAESKARKANVLYAVAGGAAAAGVTLFFVERRF